MQNILDEAVKNKNLVKDWDEMKRVETRKKQAVRTKERIKKQKEEMELNYSPES